MLIHEYTSKWTADFLQLKTLLLDALADISVSIEHVGSTAIPDLAAKPILDIDIVFHNKNDFDKIKNALEQTGYYYNGNQGITDREVFKRSASEHEEVLDAIAHHLYVCSIDSEELKRHLLFRNYLRTHAAARNEYHQLKLQLAEEANNDRKLYAHMKEEKAKAFIEGILAKANK